MGSSDPDAPLREILEEDVPLFLAMTFRAIEDRSDGGFETVAFVSVAEGLAAREGINLARVVNEHQEIVVEYLGDGLTFPQRTVEEFDRIVDEQYGSADADDSSRSPVDRDGGDSDG